MFETLVVSRPARRRGAAQASLSLLCHAVLLSLAVRASSGVAESPGAPRDLPLPAWEAPGPPPRTTPSQVALAAPAPPAAPTLVAPVAVPLTLPPIDLGEPAIDPARFAPLGGPDAPTDRPPRGVSRIPGGGAPADGLFRSREVDQPARRIGGPLPRYPAVMRAVGIDGVVRVRLVVGVDGRAEEGSITVVSSTNAAFEREAIEAVRRSSYRPASLGGRPVRQLVELSVSFHLREG